MALITAKELIEEVYRRLAQDTEIAQSAIAATDDNPTYPRSVVLSYLNAAECNFRSRLSGHCSLWRGYVELDIATGIQALPEDFLGDLQLTAWRSDTQPESVIEPVEESWLDANRPTWRNETVTVPSQYILKQTDTGGESPEQRLGVYFVDQPTATITDGARGPYTQRPTEMSDDDDPCTSLWAFPQIQRTVTVYDALSMLIEYGSTQAGDARAQHYANLCEREMGKARSICASLASRTHTNAKRRR